ncbi:hypothetical protein SFA35_20765 [Pseudomonas sp. HR96]|uniref:hypothetical protein n=1 Tax=Pseudomonas sp. HR96 TaxID=1027966 RepID=UPI002A75FF60|nr:hypothetical protein [Pseudomonas sp. HR96]WPO99019.1 hypothetical protein SFA35_20765 [Pseudomonas sp. HR96]
MSLFEIVFSGETVPGVPVEQVRSNLARLFQADEHRVALLFSGRRLVLKNNLDDAAAEKYRATLERAGARALVVAMAAEIEEIEMTAPPPPPAALPRAQVTPRDVYMAAFVAVDAPDFPMAAVGADLQEAKPVARAPQLDLGQFSVAPAGADMGQVKAPPAPAAPDTSHLKIIQ